MFWCNGKIFTAGSHLISLADRGLTHGLGLFETILAVDGNGMFWERHLARLRESCRRLGWSAENELPTENDARQLLVACGLANGQARIRLAMTGGSGSLHHLTAGDDRLVWMSAAPMVPQAESLKAIISPWLRNECSPLAGMKCASYAENLLALELAANEGHDECLWFNTHQELCEACTANVFVVNHGNLRTPPLNSGCLPGIARAWVLETAAALNIPCCVEPITRSDLMAAEEIFITNSLRGPVQVTDLCGIPQKTAQITAIFRHQWLKLLGV